VTALLEAEPTALELCAKRLFQNSRVAEDTRGKEDE